MNNFENYAEGKKQFEAEYCPNCEGAGVRDGCAVCDSQGLIAMEKIQKNNSRESEKSKIGQFIQDKINLMREMSAVSKKIHENEKKIIDAVKNIIDINKIASLYCNSTDHENALEEGYYYLIGKTMKNLDTDHLEASSWNAKLILKDGTKMDLPDDSELFYAGYREEDAKYPPKEMYLHFSENPDLLDEYAKDENKSENYCAEHGPCHVCDRYNECSDMNR